ncbi:MAG: F-box protein [Methylomonas sp.]|jgi:hypothetical protein|uniref:hypothetical protein n=1 Tax=Methylomonas sp. TaxID=418 RepID=UPI0025FABB3F|nr:hypothetical protein [Methylomonas sp.]MCK9608530.1 F-box protein [Methylomonas sp.]
MDNFDIWQIILDYFNARLLAHCAQVCTTFRKLAQDIFDRKAKEAYNDVIAAVSLFRSEDDESRGQSVFCAFERFGDWCPEHCAEFMRGRIDFDKYVPPKDNHAQDDNHPFNTMTVFLDNHLFPSIDAARGVTGIITALNGFLRDPRIMRCDRPHQFRPRCSIFTTFCADVLSKRITIQNADVVLQFLDDMPCKKTAYIFDRIISNAVMIQYRDKFARSARAFGEFVVISLEAEYHEAINLPLENWALLDKVLAFVKTSKTGKIEDTDGQVFPSDSPHPLFAIYNFMHNQPFIEKYEPHIPEKYQHRIPEFISYHGGKISDLEAFATRKSYARFDAIHTLRFALDYLPYANIVDWATSRIIADHGENEARKIIANYVESEEKIRQRLPENRICWILRIVNFESVEKSEHFVRRILHLQTVSAETANTAAAFIRRNNILAIAQFKADFATFVEQLIGTPEAKAILTRELFDAK